MAVAGNRVTCGPVAGVGLLGFFKQVTDMKLYHQSPGVYAGVHFVDGSAEVAHEDTIKVLKKFYGCIDQPPLMGSSGKKATRNLKPETPPEVDDSVGEF